MKTNFLNQLIYKSIRGRVIRSGLIETSVILKTSDVSSENSIFNNLKVSDFIIYR